MQDAHPDVPIYTAAIDRDLNEPRLHPAGPRRRRRPHLRHEVNVPFPTQARRSPRPLTSHVIHPLRRLALAAAALAAGARPGLALAQAKLKVAAIYTVPFEQQWVGRIHKALKAAEARGEIEYKATENVTNADYERVMRQYADRATS